VVALLGDLDTHSAGRNIFATNRLAESLPALGLSSSVTAVAGMLTIGLSSSSDHLVWLLPELAVTVNWAGNPDHVINQADGKLTPRKSFAAWKESVSGRSRLWDADEIDAAMRLRSAIREFTLAQADERAGERNRLHQRQELIMAELDHRVKNILATIQSLVRFSSKSAASLSSFTQALEQRLVSMARAHDLLTSSRWTGASLHSLIKEELSAFCEPGTSSLKLVGDDVSLNPSAALSLSLLLHELATNAAKYGCLSVAGGRLSIRIERVANDAAVSLISIHWIERGGPPVAPPQRRGFGRLLLEKVYENDASGAGVSLAFEREGLRCTIDLPAERIVIGEQQLSVSSNVAH
jgi:two-component sensor histidine kinase